MTNPVTSSRLNATQALERMNAALSSNETDIDISGFLEQAVSAVKKMLEEKNYQYSTGGGRLYFAKTNEANVAGLLFPLVKRSQEAELYTELTHEAWLSQTSIQKNRKA